MYKLCYTKVVFEYVMGKQGGPQLEYERVRKSVHLMLLDAEMTYALNICQAIWSTLPTSGVKHLPLERCRFASRFEFVNCNQSHSNIDDWGLWKDFSHLLLCGEMSYRRLGLMVLRCIWRDVSEPELIWAVVSTSVELMVQYFSKPVCFGSSS